MKPKTSNPASPMFAIAQRHERDCWNVLIKHVGSCQLCIEQRKVRGLNGLGCNIGRACRDEWLIAAERSYNLAEQFPTK